jgi:hypothetical protein
VQRRLRAAVREQEDAVHTGERLGQGVGPAQVAAGDLDPRREARPTGMPGQRADALAPGDELYDDLSADGSRGSGDQDHRAARPRARSQVAIA